MKKGNQSKRTEKEKMKERRCKRKLREKGKTI